MKVASPEIKWLNSSTPKHKELHYCKKCGGRLAKDYEDITCINCGAVHDEHGELLIRKIFEVESPIE